MKLYGAGPIPAFKLARNLLCIGMVIEDKIYNVTFKMWINPYHWEVPVRAYDHEHAGRIARRICKFGVIDRVEEICETDANYELGTEENTQHLIDYDD